MRSPVILAALATVIATGARADFVVHNQPLAPSPATPTPAPPPEPDPVTSANDADQEGVDKPETPPAPTPPRFKMAYGFGNQVPLSFACKQIVPHAVRVTYGPGADPNAIVSWKGGDTWNHVLRDAVRPLGLELVMTHMAVEIRR